MNLPRIADCGWLAKAGVGGGGVGTGAEGSIGNEIVAVVECVECLGDSFETETVAKRKGAAETGIHIEEVEADTTVASNDGLGQYLCAVGDASHAGT